MITIPPKYAGRAAVSPDEAAEIAGVSVATFYRHTMPHVYSGIIASFKIGACRRIIVASLLAWLDSRVARQES